MKRKFAILTAAIVGLSITAVTSVSSQKFYIFPQNNASALSIIANIKEVSLENDSIKVGETTHLKVSFDTGVTYNAQCYSSDSSIVKVLSGSANDGWEIEGIADGTAKIIVSNGGIYEKSIDITVTKEQTLNEQSTEENVCVEPGCYMEVVSQPDKITYQIGENLDLTGLKIDVMFAPGGEMPISQIDNDWRKVIDAANPLENDYFVVDTSEFDSSKTGTYNVKISLTDEACQKWWYCSPSKISVTVLDEIVKCDVNADGKFDISDVVLLQKWLLGVSDVTLPNWKAADFYEDGKLNVLDLCMMKCKLIENSYNRDEDVFSPCETTINEEFLAYGVVITMKKQYKTNPLRIWTKEDFKNVQNINFISDATTQSSERQIIYITLIEQSKENVLKLIQEIENLNIPDIYMVRTMNFNSNSEVPI